MKKGVTLLCIAFVLLLQENFLEILGESEESHNLHQGRSRRSIFKDALPKDEEGTNNMRQKIHLLETSMKTVQDNMKKLSEKDRNIETAVNQQTAVLKTIESQFSSLQKQLSSHGEVLEDLGKLANPDGNLFALSNQTCGGVLVGQSGSIVFSSLALTGMVRKPSSCVWTIRANNHAMIKLTTQQSLAYSLLFSISNAYVVEVNVNGSGTNATNPLIKITKLQRNMPQIFAGPLIFVVKTQVSELSDSFHVQFEGMGKMTQKSTFFTHEIRYENDGNFSDTSLESWSPAALQSLSQENVNYTLDYTSIVISNFSTKVHLEAILGRGGAKCPEGSSFTVISDLQENSTVLNDCCTINCEGKNSIINYDQPFIILIRKRFQQAMPFNLTWVAETPYPSSSTYFSRYLLSSTLCGEVLGGTTGTLTYKPHTSYRNSERCIWVIVPQPRPRTSIVINVGANGVENTYDHLYMLELVDVYGNPHPDAPKITRLGRYGTYEARSREVYVVFYSDSTVTGYGFSLTWRSSGVVVQARSDVTTRFNIFKEDDGSAKSIQSKELSFSNNFYQVFLLTPVVPSSYSFGMELNLTQIAPVPGPNDCLHQELTAYTGLDGILTKANLECDTPGKVTLKNADGIAMIVMNSRLTSPNIAMNFTWKEEFGRLVNGTNIIVDNNNCGGVIIGEKGVLKYRIGMDYTNNERCVWLLHSPKSQSITLKLLKDGFESCCDYILVNTIDTNSGRLRNETIKISRTNRTQTFEEPALVLTFRSDASTRGKGFALQFTGNGEAPANPEYRYRLQHKSEPYGTIEYPGTDWDEGEEDGDSLPNPSSRKEIVVIASSIKVGSEEDPATMPTNISWTEGAFSKSSTSCIFDSLAIYTTPSQEGWLERETYPSGNGTLACPNEVAMSAKKDICSTVYSSFLLIYKPVPDPVSNKTGNIKLTYEKSAGCGGVFVGQTGDISYKEDGKYSNGERCIWLIEVPQARQIRFRLERSGLEDCCDVLTISSLDSVGHLHKSAIISQTNRTATVTGPVAVVTFYSDSSVIGDGFRLSFVAESTITSDYPSTYHLEHQNQPRRYQYSYQAEANQYLIYAFSPENNRLLYSSGSTSVTMSYFRPQLNETCHSDKLSFYSFAGRTEGFTLTRSFARSGVLGAQDPAEIEEYDDWFGNHTSANQTSSLSSNNCTSVTDSEMTPCESPWQCIDNAVTFYTNSTIFVAVYKSVNVTGSMRFRGFGFVVAATY